jgi:hypothetical protein
MITLVFGDENSPKPIPGTMRIHIMYHIGVVSEMNVRKKRPIAVSAIPVDAMRRGSMRSDSLPARGDTIA